MARKPGNGRDNSRVSSDRNDDQTESKDTLTATTGGEVPQLARRRYLKLAGVAAITAGGAVGTIGSAVAEDYDTVTLDAGEQRTVRVGSGETLSNTLFDITADGADVSIRTSGSGWRIENVGVRGKFSRGGSDYGDPDKTGGHNEVLDVNGSGVVDTVYLGDGLEDGVDKALMIVSIGDVSDEITVNALYGAEFTNNGNYTAGYAREGDGKGGSMTFTNCYMRDNNVAHWRVCGNLTLRNCVIHNTNDVTPLYESAGGNRNVVYSRGIRADYATFGTPVEVTNCDIEVTDDVTNGGAAAVMIDQDGKSGQIVLNDCEVRGSISDGVVQNNVGSDPDLTPPEGVPMTAEEAAAGTSSATDGGGDETTETQTDASKTLSVSGGSPTNEIQYAFSVSDSVEKSVADGGTISSEDTISGTSVEGLVAGGTDSFSYTGEVTSFSLDGDATVSIDGQQVDPNQLGTEETPTETEAPSETETETGTPSDGSTDDGATDDGSTDGGSTDSGSTDEDVLLIDGTTNPEETTRYTFDVSGVVTRNVARSTVEDGGMAWDSIEDYVHDGSVVGIVGNGVDAYGFTGRITDIDVRGEATFTVVRS